MLIPCYYFDQYKRKVYGEIMGMMLIGNAPHFIIIAEDGSFDYRPLEVVHAVLKEENKDEEQKGNC